MRNGNQKLVREYCKKFPNTPNLTLAKKIYEKHKDRFKNVEHIRSLVRTVRGASGASRRGIADILEKELMQMFEEDFKAPEPIELSKGKYLVLCDLHLPFHEPKALAIALEKAKNDKVDNIILDGDIVDSYQLSNFCRNPSVSLFKQERNCAEQFIKLLRKIFPKANIFWKDGNHDARIMTYMWQNAPAIWDEEYFNWQKMLRFDYYNIIHIKSQQWVKLGKLALLHGHEFSDSGRFGSASSVNPARGLFLKTKQCSACGHHHQTSQHNETTVSGELITTWSIGCLSTLNPMYRPITKWNYGFAICDVDNRGHFWFRNFRILNNMELVD